MKSSFDKAGKDFDRKRGNIERQEDSRQVHGRIESFDNGTQPVNLSIVGIQSRNVAINSEASRSDIYEILIQQRNRY